jgi:hypothetical protein
MEVTRTRLFENSENSEWRNESSLSILNKTPKISSYVLYYLNLLVSEPINRSTINNKFLKRKCILKDFSIDSRFGWAFKLSRNQSKIIWELKSCNVSTSKWDNPSPWEHHMGNFWMYLWRLRYILYGEVSS